jgi:two-component system, NarL family, response regulator DevR
VLGGGPQKFIGGRTPKGVTVRVFLVDDHEVVRRGVKDLIEAAEGMSVVGEAETAEQALSLLPRTDPDVAVLDVRLPDGDGVELCRELKSRSEHLKALMLTSFDDEEALMNAVMAGAAGYVLKQIRGTDLVDAIRQVAEGKSLLNPLITDRAFGRLREISQDRTDHPKNADVNVLSPQERRILDLIANGCTNRQIAAQMFLSEKTVKNYVSNLLRKLGMRGRTEAAVYATLLTKQRMSEGRMDAQGRSGTGSQPPPRR